LITEESNRTIGPRGLNKLAGGRLIIVGNFGRVGKSRILLNKSGLFDEAASLRSVEDYELCSRLLMHSDGVGLCEPLVGYRIPEAYSLSP
jgi:hypothetical protein